MRTSRPTSSAGKFAAALANKGINTRRVSQSSLILAQPILAGNTTYTFPVLQNQAPVLPNEIRLSLQDLFVVNTLAVGFSGVITVGGVDFRRNFFAPMANFNPAFSPMYALYGGSLKCVINEVTYLLNWDLGRHIADDTTQTSQAAAGVASTLTEVKGSTSAFFPVNPGIVLNGQGKNEFTVQMPNNQLAPVGPIAYAPQTGAAFTISIDQVVLVLRGNLAQNASGAN